MSLNACFQVRREKTGWTSEKIVDCSHPAHIEATDLNGDGATDYLVAILGSYAPEDHNKGQVVWYRPELGEQGNTIILKDVGRVADVQPADFDGDGDLDLIVAEFGWRRTGQIRLLEQTGMQEGVPRFRSSIIDKRHGAIHVPVADIDGDGDLDFVALVAQEFEEVAAFLNRGDGQFERQVIFQAGNPSYGSSGIQVVDLDGDRDLDVLLTNGDSLDSNYLKSYHGIHWLENRGDYPFEYHLLTQLPGVCRAVTGDLDGDGDLDVAACAWVPHDTRSKASTDDGKFETLLWLQNHKNESFARHVLAAESQAGYMTLDTGDADADGDLDIVAGYFQSKGQTSRWVDIYLNQGRRK